MYGHSYKDDGFVLYSAVFANILVAGAHQEIGEPKPLLFCWFLFVLSELLQTQSLGYFKAEMSLCCRHFNRDTHKDLLKRSGEYKIIK